MRMQKLEINLTGFDKTLTLGASLPPTVLALDLDVYELIPEWTNYIITKSSEQVTVTQVGDVSHTVNVVSCLVDHGFLLQKHRLVVLITTPLRSLIIGPKQNFWIQLECHGKKEASAHLVPNYNLCLFHQPSEVEPLIFTKEPNYEPAQILALRSSNIDDNGIDIVFKKTYNIHGVGTLCLKLPFSGLADMHNRPWTIMLRSSAARKGVIINTDWEKGIVYIVNLTPNELDLGDRFLQILLPDPYCFEARLNMREVGKGCDYIYRDNTKKEKTYENFSKLNGSLLISASI